MKVTSRKNRPRFKFHNDPYPARAFKFKSRLTEAGTLTEFLRVEFSMTPYDGPDTASLPVRENGAYLVRRRGAGTIYHYIGNRWWVCADKHGGKRLEFHVPSREPLSLSSQEEATLRSLGRLGRREWMSAEARQLLQDLDYARMLLETQRGAARCRVRILRK